MRLKKANISGLVISVGKPPRIFNEGAIDLGDRVFFRTVYQRISLTVRQGASLKIGSRTLVNEGCKIVAVVGIEIGENCLLGDGVTIYDTSFHAADEGKAPHVAPVKLGRNVWLARSVIVLPGVEIGDHSVIGAGSVVTKSIPPRKFAAGVPACVIRDITCSDKFRRD